MSAINLFFERLEPVVDRVEASIEDRVQGLVRDQVRPAARWSVHEHRGFVLTEHGLQLTTEPHTNFFDGHTTSRR